MTRITGKIELSGPFFRKDPAKVLKGNMREMLDDLGQEVARSITAEMRAGEGRRRPVRALGRGGRVSQRIVGGAGNPHTGKSYRYHAVVAPSLRGLSKKQAIALYAAAAQVEKQTRVVRRHVRAARFGSREMRKLLKGLT